MRPFWEAVLAAGHETIVHAGRGEMEFCLQATGRLPERLFDVQIAAGLAGLEYPAGFGTLVQSGAGPVVGEARDPHRLAAPPAVEAADRIRPGRRPAFAAAPRQALGPARASWAA